MAENNESRKTKVFISYSRKNKLFVSKLNKALDENGIETWLIGKVFRSAPIGWHKLLLSSKRAIYHPFRW